MSMTASLPDYIWLRMTNEEQYEHLCRSCCGFMQYDGDGNWTILMGIKAINRLRKYEKQMIKKYEDKETN